MKLVRTQKSCQGGEELPTWSRGLPRAPSPCRGLCPVAPPAVGRSQADTSCTHTHVGALDHHRVTREHTHTPAPPDLRRPVRRLSPLSHTSSGTPGGHLPPPGTPAPSSPVPGAGPTTHTRCISECPTEASGQSPAPPGQADRQQHGVGGLRALGSPAVTIPPRKHCYPLRPFAIPLRLPAPHPCSGPSSLCREVSQTGSLQAEPGTTHGRHHCLLPKEHPRQGLGPHVKDQDTQVTLNVTQSEGVGLAPGTPLLQPVSTGLTG